MAFLDAGTGGEAGPATSRVARVASTLDDASNASSSVRLLTPDSGLEEDQEAGTDRPPEKGEVAGCAVELRDLDRRTRQRQQSGVSAKRSRLSYTAEEERAVVRKFDRRLVLFVALLYMLSFLDRSNIGNARVAGMDDDLQTTPPRDSWYAWSLSAFYTTYIAFEWLALLWRLLPAHAYVAVLVAGWGLAAALQAVATSYPMLVILRCLLGVGEAGFAGIPLYLARFFRRDELAMRTAIFIAAAPLATTFAATLAWVILAVARHVASPIAPWRLLFLIEGFPSVLAAVAAWRILPDAPDQARYLTRRERRLARERLLSDDGDDGDDDETATTSGSTSNSSFLSTSAAVLADPAAWITAAMFFLANMAYSSLPVFLPTILTSMGHGPVAAQALSAPPYLAAFLVVLATAHVSDHMRARSPLLVAHALASAAGYGVLSLRRTSSVLRYVAIYPAAIGFFNVVVLLITWNLNNQRGEGRQGAAFALFQVVGQCGPLVGTRLYPDSDKPLFLRGMRTMAAAMLAVAALAATLRLVLRQRNRRLDASAAAPTEAQLGGEEDEERYSDSDSDSDSDSTEIDADANRTNHRHQRLHEEEQEGLVGGRKKRRRGRYHSSVYKQPQQDRFRYML